MTITEAIKQVMRTKGAPMTADEAYRAIAEAKLYELHADNPAHIVRSQIRRHCEGLDFPSASPTKHFKLVGENRFEPLSMHQRGQVLQYTNPIHISSPFLTALLTVA